MPELVITKPLVYVDFRCDWVEVGTVKELEKKLRSKKGSFKFKGAGWYMPAEEETILVVPADETKEPWHYSVPYSYGNDKRYRVFFWNLPAQNVANIFNAIINAPVRS